jgi:hypothetical protein
VTRSAEHPPLPRQQPRQDGEEEPVGRLATRVGDLAAQDRELVAQYGDLDIRGLRPWAPTHQLEHIADGQEPDRAGSHGWILPDPSCLVRGGILNLHPSRPPWRLSDEVDVLECFGGLVTASRFPWPAASGGIYGRGADHGTTRRGRRPGLASERKRKSGMHDVTRQRGMIHQEPVLTGV